MRYRNVIILLGFIVLVLQFLGFPSSWDSAFYAACGALIITFGYLAGKDRRESVRTEAPVAAEEASVQEAKTL